MASMSGLFAYAGHVVLCCLSSAGADLSRLSAAGAFADVHRYFQRVWLCVENNVISWLAHLTPVLYLVSSPLSRKNFACVMLHCYGR
jgi:hypothetical protein